MGSDPESLEDSSGQVLGADSPRSGPWATERQDWGQGKLSCVWLGMQHLGHALGDECRYRNSELAFFLAVSKGPQRQFRYCWWYRSSHGTDFDVSEMLSPAICAFC